AGSRLGRGPRLHALVPRRDVLVLRVERLADAGAEIQEAEQVDVAHGEARAAEILLARHLAVEPGQAVLRDLLQAVRGFGHAHHAGLEQAQALAVAEAVGERLDDVQIDAARPHAGLRL